MGFNSGFKGLNYDCHVEDMDIVSKFKTFDTINTHCHWFKIKQSHLHWQHTAPHQTMTEVPPACRTRLARFDSVLGI